MIYNVTISHLSLNLTKLKTNDVEIRFALQHSKRIPKKIKIAVLTNFNIGLKPRNCSDDLPIG